ncbi:MAG TPA: CHAT domain-containing protein, partial [Kofleriaceae bacterium]|nr:CHAT domain-containing protein [Kofleriaceae bacterium]
AWRNTQSEAAAVAGAWWALTTHDDAGLERWGVRAQPTIPGSRILHFVSDMQRQHGELARAEAALRIALDLQIDRDPVRAANTAVSLLELVQSNDPPKESIRIARIAWEQAELANAPGHASPASALAEAYAGNALAGVLIDLGERSTAAAVIERMEAADPLPSPALRDGAKARLEAARGRKRLAVELFRRASHPDPDDLGGLEPLQDAIGFIQALLDDGQLGEARRELDRAVQAVRKGALLQALDTGCRLAAVQASVELAEGDIAGALATVDRGLADAARDAARVQLLNVRGDALAGRGDAIAAEQAWKAAADSVEAWRASIPATQLRGGLVARHRHALESWLDSAGARGDAAAAFQVMQRIIGRELLDRIRQRETNAPATVDDSVRDVEHRLVAWDRSVVLAGPPDRHELRELRHDFAAVMFGARSAWAIRHVRGRSWVDRVGDRGAIAALVDAYRRAIDDPRIAAELGAALFPAGALPELPGAPLVVMLDRELSDIALAGLRVGDRYLVERAAILEVLAPELLFAPAPRRACDRAVAVGDPRGDLPGAVDEVHAVARALAAAEHLGARATGDAVRRAGDACVLHVAVHSKIDDGRAAFVLADGALSANDIANGKIAPRLAVIATCRSQVDDDPAASLTAAFLAAGAPGVIGVKRAYDDVDGAPLLLEFYRRYRRGGDRDPVQALAGAQRAAIRRGRPPRAWATVSLFGVAGWIQ